MSSEPGARSTISRRRIGKSAVRPPSEAHCLDGALSILTDHLTTIQLRQKPTPDWTQTLWCIGQPSEVSPSSAVWGRAKWELHICVSLRNGTTNQLAVYDINACTYH